MRNFRMDKGKGHLLHFSGRKPESEVCQAGRANPAVQRNHQHFNQQKREQRSGHPSGPVDLLLVGGFNMEVLHRPIWNNTFLLDWFLRTSMMVEKGQGPGIVKSEQHYHENGCVFFLGDPPNCWFPFDFLHNHRKG